MIYVDTSIIVSAITNEPVTELVVAWLSRQPPGSLWASDWVDTEVESALAIKARRLLISAEERNDARAQWQQLRAVGLLNIAVASADFRSATDLVARSATPLRAADALHLAIAMSGGCGVATRDAEFAAAADAFGVVTHLL